MTEKQYVTVEVGPSGFKSTVNAGTHSLIADEPVSAGGTDEGLSPYDFLASGLGACTAMTLRMYADLKKWDLQGVIVHVSHEKVDSEDGNSKVDLFTREIEFIGDLDEKQYERMLIIADKCPVHKTLTHSSMIHTTQVYAH